MRFGSIRVLSILMAGGLIATSCGGRDEEATAPNQVLTSAPAATAEPVVRLEPTAAPARSPTSVPTPTPAAGPAPAATLTASSTATPMARSETRRKGVSQVAFVGLEGQNYTVDPDGSHPLRISPETGIFTWPTWSPDASRLVFSGVVEDEGGNLRISLDDLTDGVGAALILDQGPLWMSWSPDSHYLLVHRGADHFLVNTLEGTRVDELGIRAVGYRVPAWKPPGAVVTPASGDAPGRYTILTAEVVVDGLDAPKPITFLHEIGFPLNPAFLWSPSGDFLALAGSTRVISYLGLPLLVYRDLALFSESENTQTILIQDNVMAYFWSPDGSRLAYVAPSQKTGILRWMVLNVVNGERWPLVDFVPSRDQLTMFQFFDQYAYSHSLWSPDGRSLVFAGKLVDEAEFVSATYDVARQGSHIIVVGTDPDPLTQTIAEGILGFWSPR